MALSFFVLEKPLPLIFFMSRVCLPVLFGEVETMKIGVSYKMNRSGFCTGARTIGSGSGPPNP
jgi:hypothetical protein